MSTSQKRSATVPEKKVLAKQPVKKPISGAVKQPEKKVIANQPEKKVPVVAVAKEKEEDVVKSDVDPVDQDADDTELETEAADPIKIDDDAEEEEEEAIDGENAEKTEISIIVDDDSAEVIDADNDKKDSTPAGEEAKDEKLENGDKKPAVQKVELDENGERIVVVMHFKMDKLTDLGMLDPFLTNCNSIRVNINGAPGTPKSLGASIQYRTSRYKEDLEALKALTIDGKPLEGVTILGLPADVETRVYVYNIPEDTIEEMLRVLFPTAKRVSILKTSDGKSKGCAILTYESLTEAKKCVEENDEIKIEDDVLKLKIMKDSKPKILHPDRGSGGRGGATNQASVLKRPRTTGSRDNAPPMKKPSIVEPRGRGRGRGGRGAGRGRGFSAPSMSGSGRFESSAPSRGGRGRGGLLAHPGSAMPLMSGARSHYDGSDRRSAGRGILGANPVISQGMGSGRYTPMGSGDSLRSRSIQLERQNEMVQKQKLLQQDISHRLLQRANQQQQYGARSMTPASSLYSASAYETGMDRMAPASSYADVGTGADYDTGYYQGGGRLSGTASHLGTSTSMFGEYQSGYGPASSNREYF